MAELEGDKDHELIPEDFLTTEHEVLVGGEWFRFKSRPFADTLTVRLDLENYSGWYYPAGALVCVRKTKPQPTKVEQVRELLGETWVQDPGASQKVVDRIDAIYNEGKS